MGHLMAAQRIIDQAYSEVGILQRDIPARAITRSFGLATMSVVRGPDLPAGRDLADWEVCRFAAPRCADRLDTVRCILWVIRHLRESEGEQLGRRATWQCISASERVRCFAVRFGARPTGEFVERPSGLLQIYVGKVEDLRRAIRIPGAT